MTTIPLVLFDTEIPSVNIGIFEPKRSVGLPFVLFDMEIPSVNIGIFDPKGPLDYHLYYLTGTRRFPLLTWDKKVRWTTINFVLFDTEIPSVNIGIFGTKKFEKLQQGYST